MNIVSYILVSKVVGFGYRYPGRISSSTRTVDLFYFFKLVNLKKTEKLFDSYTDVK